MYTNEEKVTYFSEKITDRAEMNQFFSNAIAVQNNAYGLRFAENNYEVSCEVLSRKGFCNHHDCEQCKLKWAHERAKDEILCGIRRSPMRNRKNDIRITVSKVNGHEIVTMVL